jgi:hypothetical protein
MPLDAGSVFGLVMVLGFFGTAVGLEVHSRRRRRKANKQEPAATKREE